MALRKPSSISALLAVSGAGAGFGATTAVLAGGRGASDSSRSILRSFSEPDIMIAPRTTRRRTPPPMAPKSTSFFFLSAAGSGADGRAAEGRGARTGGRVREARFLGGRAEGRAGDGGTAGWD